MLIVLLYYYLVNFNKNFSNVLLPQTKIPSRFPKIISKQDFIKMFNSEFNLKHKIWIMLAYGSGLRISEVASLKVSDILSKEHKIRVTGKGNKERYAPLPDFTLKLLRLYWIQNKDKITNNYFFSGKYKTTKDTCITSFGIKEAFQKIKENNNLNNSITFHTLRHSYATEFIRRFLLHVLLDNFIKHYGLLSNRNKQNNIRLCRLLISRILTNEFVSTLSRKFRKFKCEKCGSTNFSYSFQYNIHRLRI